MKNIVLSVLISGSILASENPFIINSNKMRTEENSYMSVLDIYEIDLFDEKIQEQVKENKNEEKIYAEKAEDNLFKEKRLNFEEKLDKSIEECRLFEADKSTNKKQKIENNQDDSLKKVMIIIICVLINIIAALLTIKKWISRMEKLDEEKI